MGESSVLFAVQYGPMTLIIILPTQTSEEYWARCNVSSRYVPTQKASNYPKITFWREEGGGVLIHLGSKPNDGLDGECNQDALSSSFQTS